MVGAARLEKPRANLEDSIKNVVHIINGNGVFNVIGWYKRGEIYDQSNKYNVDGTERVEAEMIGYHVVHMYLTNCNADEYRLSKFNIHLLN